MIGTTVLQYIHGPSTARILDARNKTFDSILADFRSGRGTRLILTGASPSQENMKGKTAVDLAQSETTMALLCPLHFAAGRGMLDNLVALVAKVRKTPYCI